MGSQFGKCGIEFNRQNFEHNSLIPRMLGCKIFLLACITQLQQITSSDYVVVADPPSLCLSCRVHGSGLWEWFTQQCVLLILLKIPTVTLVSHATPFNLAGERRSGDLACNELCPLQGSGVINQIILFAWHPQDHVLQQLHFYFTNSRDDRLGQDNRWHCTFTGYSSLKVKQRKALKAFAEGRDEFVSLPTGYGKSFCYAYSLFLIARRI